MEKLQSSVGDVLKPKDKPRHETIDRHRIVLNPVRSGSRTIYSRDDSRSSSVKQNRRIIKTNQDNKPASASLTKAHHSRKISAVYQDDNKKCESTHKKSNSLTKAIKMNSRRRSSHQKSLKLDSLNPCQEFFTITSDTGNRPQMFAVEDREVMSQGQELFSQDEANPTESAP